MAFLNGLGTALVGAGLAVGVMALLAWQLDLPAALVWAVAVPAALYALVAGILESYPLGRGRGWALLAVDMVWSLPSTVLGACVGTLIYVFFGTPSRSLSKDQEWVAFAPRGSSGFGVDVLQTVGTVNLGGAGAHERVHLLQARILGPAFLPFVVACYVVTSVIQLLAIPVCLILRAAGARESWHLEPPSSSAVSGFFGWIYYATPIELWAYATERSR